MRDSPFGILNAFWLKMIMAVLMVLDHLYYNLFPQQLFWAHCAARIVAPIFTFLVAEGVYYTRDRWRYISRILIFALIMLVGNALLYILYGSWITNSILVTLAISAAIITCLDKFRQRDGIQWLLIAVALFLISSYFEGGTTVPLMALLFYYLRWNRWLMCGAYFLLFGGMQLLELLMRGNMQVQGLMCLAFIPILLYNNKRGPSNVFSKYFFYVFYPLHLWIIFLIEQAVL